MWLAASGFHEITPYRDLYRLSLFLQPTSAELHYDSQRMSANLKNKDLQAIVSGEKLFTMVLLGTLCPSTGQRPESVFAVLIALDFC